MLGEQMEKKVKYLKKFNKDVLIGMLIGLEFSDNYKSNLINKLLRKNRKVKFKDNSSNETESDFYKSVRNQKI